MSYICISYCFALFMKNSQLLLSFIYQFSSAVSVNHRTIDKVVDLSASTVTQRQHKANIEGSYPNINNLYAYVYNLKAHVALFYKCL